MAWKHPTQYRHYIQLQSQGNTAFLEVDIEEYFKCRYVSLEGAENPSVKSVYVESYGGHDGDRVWTGPDVYYNSSELTLTLRWLSSECGDVREWSEKFADYIAGKKFEYSDTFRGKRWQVLFKDSPAVKAERYYGAPQYRFVSYKLTNFGGKPTKRGQTIIPQGDIEI